MLSYLMPTCGNPAAKFLNNQEGAMSETITPEKDPKSPFAFLVDAKLAVERSTTRTKIRQSHLARNQTLDPYTDKARKLLEDTEKIIDGWVTTELKKHPAYHWFSRIKGIGNENIAKVLGPIDISRAKTISSLWKYAGMHVVNTDVSTQVQKAEIDLSIDALQKKLNQLRKKTEHKIGEDSSAGAVMTPVVIDAIIEYNSARLENLAPIVRGHAPHPVPGHKLEYNKELRVMCFRLAGALLKAGLRKYCVECGNQKPPKDDEDTKSVCKECGSTEFRTKPISRYAQFYEREKAKLVSRYRERGIQIIPSLELPKNKDGKFFEPVGTIASGHVHMQAMRKMIKLFLSHLWLVWREAEGLPITEPYAYSVLGHTKHDYIGPWEMVEKPARKPRQRRTSIEAVASV